MISAQAKRSAAELFHLVDGVSMPLLFDDHPPLMARPLTVFSVGYLSHVARG